LKTKLCYLAPIEPSILFAKKIQAKAGQNANWKPVAVLQKNKKSYRKAEEISRGYLSQKNE